MAAGRVIAEASRDSGVGAAQSFLEHRFGVPQALGFRLTKRLIIYIMVPWICGVAQNRADWALLGDVIRRKMP